jgi:hypothetical protein
MTEKLTIEQLRELALANGIAIMDYMDVDDVRYHAGKMPNRIARQILAVFSSRRHEWRACMNWDYFDSMICRIFRSAGWRLAVDKGHYCDPYSDTFWPPKGDGRGDQRLHATEFASWLRRNSWPNPIEYYDLFLRECGDTDTSEY